MDRAATSEKTHILLDELLVSDIATTGVDNRDDLGAVTSALSQILFKPDLRRFFDGSMGPLVANEAYVAAYQAVLDARQDPAARFWTDRVFPDADCRMIKAKLASLALDESPARDAMAIVERRCQGD